MQDKKLPSETIKRSELKKQIKPLDLLECVPVNILTILVDPQEGESMTCIEIESKRYLVPLEDYESSMLSFTRMGCSDVSHTRTIHQILIDTNKEFGRTLESAILEGKQGDVMYARLLWKDHKGRSSFLVCTPGDAMILHSLVKESKFTIVRSLIGELEIFEEGWNDFDGEDDG